MSKVAAALIAGSVGAVWAACFGYCWWLWMTGAFRLRRRLYAEGHGAGTLARLYAHARAEDPRSPEAARLLRGLRGVLVTSVALVVVMIATMMIASAARG